LITKQKQKKGFIMKDKNTEAQMKDLVILGEKTSLVLLRDEKSEVFTEEEAKKELSKNRLDYTYFQHLFIKVEYTEGDTVKFYYIKQFNFDFCVAEIQKRKELESSTRFYGGW